MPLSPPKLKFHWRRTPPDRGLPHPNRGLSPSRAGAVPIPQPLVPCGRRKPSVYCQNAVVSVPMLAASAPLRHNNLRRRFFASSADRSHKAACVTTFLYLFSANASSIDGKRHASPFSRYLLLTSLNEMRGFLSTDLQTRPSRSFPSGVLPSANLRASSIVVISSKNLNLSLTTFT